jgi:signal peptidase II
MLKWLWLSLFIIATDQLTKWFAFTRLREDELVPIMPGFNLTLRFNEGAAFSFLADASGWQRWFFIVLAIAVSGFIVHWLRGLSAREKMSALALSAVLGGAIGNVIDRIYLGKVIDFIDVYYEAYHWPAFNVADSAITVGAVILLFQSVFEKRVQHDANAEKERL